MPIKSLGQHWLKDRLILESIVDCADITSDDTVLEIGPGQGTLTSVILRRAGQVIAVEYDSELAQKLPKQFPGKNLTVLNHDILTYDLSQLPPDYKVVANIPYYITAKIVSRLLNAENKPKTIVLLVQKEVAQRIASQAGDMSMLALSAQVFADCTLGPIVKPEHFTPPPKVDSQVIVLARRDSPLVAESDQKDFFKIAKAGFSARRKKLRSSLAGGLGLEKNEVEKLLIRLKISPDRRAEDLTVAEWMAIGAEISRQG